MGRNSSVVIDDTHPVVAPSTRVKKSRSSWRHVPWWMMLPSFILIICLYYYPSASTLVYSFFNWNGFSKPSFAGLANYATYLSARTTPLEWLHQGIMTIGMVLVALVVPLAAAVAVNGIQNRRLSYIVKVLLVLPMAVPFIVNLSIWAFIFNPYLGPINKILRFLGLGALANGWLSAPHVAIYALIGVGFPWVAGLPFLIYLAGLQGVSHELYDAFAIDSGSSWKRFRNVDLPALRGQIKLVVILSVIGSMQNFIMILLLTNGGPGYATQVPGLSMYTAAFNNDEYGLGAAIGTVLFVVIAVITVVYMIMDRRRGDEK
ncbi:sugar ABC transporter permease [Alicyclobacillus fastidiosus]|uniref:Sugar ABC transporter permease n=1 Tax=Alicyclobacillus fastidiosus TaxID=392011 RepID=A0ABY6ZLG9_9BACL|nr:sugar ABC transporter permease [Alicyclobacillus fastidiosus]WAH43428.1 sugar ABC transporter permease [Alicyclobacillus fastidiosus]GMA59579.1 ABC transporter permease [Alicyclobacillus fastidiosus]GMA65505.1 ABC transporter permease [Alicyclobacillus fastidiosus]